MRIKKFNEAFTPIFNDDEDNSKNIEDYGREELPTKEQIPINELIEDLKNDEDFADTCEQDEHYGEALAMAELLRNFEYYSWTELPKNMKKFKFVKSYSEKGDGYEEETLYGIFQRKLDGKFFKCWVHDAGMIGPDTLTLWEYMIEVNKKSRKIENWD